LRAPPQWLSWNLADPTTREAAIADVVRELRETALPFLAQVKDIPRLSAALQREDVPLLQPAGAVELLLCYEGTEAAVAYISAYLRRHPELVPRLAAAVAHVRDVGPPPYVPTKYAEQVAIAVAHYGLPVELP
jgi:hypothetical protein